MKQLKNMRNTILFLLILLDFPIKNEEQKEDIRNLIQGVSPEYTSEVYLVLSATTKYRDLVF